jgi:RNA polymerase sigma-70 factor (ECF subfamily)
MQDTGRSGLSDDQRCAFAELYESNARAVMALCRRLLSDPEDAADAAHEVFLKAATSMSVETPGRNARSWLLAVARNHCIDLLRRRQRMGTALATLGESPDAFLEPEKAVEDREFVAGVLDKLRPRERQALWQSAVESRPLAEIAAYLGLSYMAAGQLLHRARKHAALAAAKLATALGLTQLARPGHRPNLALLTPQLAAVVVVPVLIAAATVGSSASSGRPPAAPAGADQVTASQVVKTSTSGTDLGSVASAPPIAVVPDGLSGVDPFGVAGVPAVGDAPVRGAVKSVVGSTKGVLPQVVPPPLPTAPIPLPTPHLPEALG